MKKIINVMFLLLFCATLFAQNTDTTAVAKSDTIAPKKTTELPEVGITAKKPVYMTDGEKTMYNVSEDPAVQSGTAADALQNAPGVEVDVEGNITLRGYHPARSLIGTDMAQQPTCQHERRSPQNPSAADAGQ